MESFVVFVFSLPFISFVSGDCTMLRYCGAGLCVVLAIAVLIGLAPQAQATALLANWKMNEAGGTAGMTIADSSGNGNTGTLHGTDTLTTIAGPFGASGPTGLYFNGVLGNLINTATGVNNPTPTYFSVPYNAALSVDHYVGSTPIGFNGLTLSAWIYLPSSWIASGTGVSPGSEVISLGGSAPAPNTNVYQIGDGYQAINTRRWDFQGDGTTALDFNMNTNVTKGSWQLITCVFWGGNSQSAVGIYDIYYNGVLKVGQQGSPGGGNGALYLPAATSGQQLFIGNGYSTRDNEWLGGLSDLAIWGTNLSGAPSVGPGIPGTVGDSGGEVLALYKTPTSGVAALSQYGVSSMNQLFTLYDSHSASTATVTTGNSMIQWHYVASGLTAGSGYAGQAGDGSFYVQLDGSGGGVVGTLVTPEPSTVALLASTLAGLLAYVWRKRK
jgi:hypothetical protein